MFSSFSIWGWLTTQVNARRRLTIALTLLIAALPAIQLATTVARWSVEVPSRDDWEMAPLIAKAHTGELTLADLFAQQEEARTFVPKLIFLLSAIDGHWDVRDEMMLSVAICVLTAAGIYVLLRRSGLALGTTAICFWLTMLLIFSPAQFELWIFASAFPSFLPVLCIIASLVALEMNWSNGSKFAICVALSTVSTFTLAHGLLAWGLTFPVYLLTNRILYWKRWATAWSVLALACAVLFFYGYKKPAHLPPFGPALPPLDYLQFFLAFLGSELAYASKNALALATAVGSVVMALFSLAASYAISKWRDLTWRRRALPWFALGLYSIGSGALTTLGRVGFGVQYAISSRYVTFSLYATVAVIVLLALIGSELVRSRASLIARAWLIICCIVLTLVGLDLYRTCRASTLHFLHGMSARNRLARSAILFSPVLDTSEVIKRFNYPAPQEATSRAAVLDRLRLTRPPLVQSAKIADLPHEIADERSASGLCESWVAVEGERWRVTGWAALPAKGRSADGVLLAYETAGQGWIAFALSDDVLWRYDIAKRLRRPDLAWSGWTAIFPRRAVPVGARISIWAVNADLPKLYRLKQTEGQF